MPDFVGEGLFPSVINDVIIFAGFVTFVKPFWFFDGFLNGEHTSEKKYVYQEKQNEPLVKADGNERGGGLRKRGIK